ncbi:ERF family protein, partial [Candidatus Dojkabacteria bacterium]|nr:ERF family protein [Candidatus Dojkabacteria bacterium]
MESINQAELSVFKKINLVYQEVTNVEKTATVGYGNNSYTAVEHDEVTSILKESITKHGLICIPNVTECEVEYQTYKSKNGNAERFVVRNWVELKVIDIESGGFVSTKAFAMAFDSQDKAPGKAYSMALKYCYLKLFMLKSG